MSRSKVPESYPEAMHAALAKAHREGDVIIPTETPLAMRLEFQSLRGALRAAGKGEIADQVSFHISPRGENPSWFSIRLRSATPTMLEIESALAGQPVKQTSAGDEAEAALNRILGL